jgi:hypothetical protein
MKVIRTTEGYMVELANGDYLCDMHGDNLWDTRSEAEREIALALGEEALAQYPMKSWAEFNRLRCHDNKPFYGCVAPDGTWFDSSTMYTTAVSFCCYYAGQFQLTLEEEAEWMNTEGVKLGYSIINSQMLEKMYEKGLIK